MEERDILPTTVVPENYFVSLQTDFSNFLFHGVCRVNLFIQEAVTEIVFNSLDIEYTKIKIGHWTVDLNKLKLDEIKETCTIALGFQLNPGQHIVVEMSYIGKLNDLMKGYYRSSYNKDGERAYGGSTHFEPTAARRAFPCWDEPNIKAKFTLEITAEDYMTVASNTPVAKETPNDDSTITYLFQETPLMSTYLVGWVVGEYDFKETQTSKGVIVRCYTPKGKASDGEFSCKYGAEVLEWYEKYFDIDYNLPKLDLFAIADFPIGAMENWGIVTFKSRCLLANEASGPEDKMMVARLVAHELSHMWFGNLVTMDWWKELWLKEGFANFLESYASNQLTIYNYETYYVSRTMSRAFELDSMLTSHPVEVPVQTASQVQAIFDAISYNKGGSIVRMLNNFLGPEVFQKGIQSYMKEHQFGNATTMDLWKHLGNASQVDVVKMMSNWTAKQGYPVINASLNSKNQLVLQQNRFLSSGNVPEEENQTIWHVPIVALTSTGEHRIVLTEKEMVVEDIELIDGWVHLNHGMTGLYLIKYDDILLSRLSEALVSGALENELDRYCVLHGIEYLCKAGELSATTILSILPSFKKETSEIVWNSINNLISSINSIIAGEPEQINFNGLILELLSEVQNTMGYEEKVGENSEDQILRSTILKLCSNAGDTDLINILLDKFWKFIDEGVPLDPSLKRTIYAVAGKFGGDKAYYALKERFKVHDDPGETTYLILGMAMTQIEKLQIDFLEFGLSDAMRNQDKIYVHLSMRWNRSALNIMWNFVKEHWHTLYPFRSRWLPKCAEGFVTREKANDVESFYNSVRETSPDSIRAMDQAVEKIKTQVQWRERDLQNLKEALSQIVGEN